MHLLLAQRRTGGWCRLHGLILYPYAGVLEIILVTGRMNGGRLKAAPQFCRVLFAIACMTTLAATACHHRADAAPDITVTEQITPQPAHIGPATMLVQLADTAHQPVAHASIMVEADMSHPGMSPLFATARESAPGSYRANVNFNMGGDWLLLLHIRLADGRKIERQVDVRGVGSN